MNTGNSTSPLVANILCGFLAFITLLAVIFNGLVVIVYTRSPARKKKLFVINLAVAEFLCPLFSYWMILASCYHKSWLFGKLGCTFYAFSTGLFSMTSVGSLVALAIERYTVCYYFADKHMRIRTKYYIIGGTWIYGLLMTVPPLFGWGRYVQDIFEPSCTFDYYSHDLNAQTFLAYLLIGGFFVPAVVIVFCYFSMFRQILKNERTMEEMSLRPVANSKEKKVSGLKESKSLGVSTPFDRRYSAFVCNRTNGLSDCASGATEVPIGRQLRRTVSLNEILFESPKYLADSLQKSTVSPSTWSIPSFNVSMSRTEIRFVKLTLIVISAFFICWTPYATLTLLCQFRVNAAFNSTAAAITLIFAKSSVAVNPIIYAFQERKFRLEVVGLIAGIAKKLRSSKFQ